jgi:phospholipase C
VHIANLDSKEHTVLLTDNSYGSGSQSKTVSPGKSVAFATKLEHSFNWYDLSIKLNAYPDFEERFAGRVETGAVTKTDPLMGGLV